MTISHHAFVKVSRRKKRTVQIEMVAKLISNNHYVRFWYLFFLCAWQARPTIHEACQNERVKEQRILIGVDPEKNKKQFVAEIAMHAPRSYYRPPPPQLRERAQSTQPKTPSPTELSI
jgi:hypothetical protein